MMHRESRDYNKTVKLYHGSTKEIRNPIYGFGSPDNDYGSGFYTTLTPEKADAWAVAMGGKDTGITNIYSMDLSGLNVVNLCDYGVLSWVSTILNNRSVRDAYHQLKAELLVQKYAVDLSKADVVIGCRADDSYMDVIEWFLDDKIDINDVQRLFDKGNLGIQYFIKSKEAFGRIAFEGSYPVRYSERLMEDERNARKEVSRFFSSRSVALVKDKLAITGITSTEAIDRDFVYDNDSNYYYAAPKNGLGR